MTNENNFSQSLEHPAEISENGPDDTILETSSISQENISESIASTTNDSAEADATSDATRDWAGTAEAYAELAKAPIHPLLKDHVHRLREEAVSKAEADHGNYTAGWAWLSSDQNHNPDLISRREKRADELMTKQLDEELANRFIYEGMDDLLASKLKSFPHEHQQAIAEVLATNGDATIIEKFAELPGIINKDRIGQILIENGGGRNLAQFINVFGDKNRLVDQILNPDSYKKIVSVLHGWSTKDRPVSLYTLPDKEKDLQKYINMTCQALLLHYDATPSEHEPDSRPYIQKAVDRLIDQEWTGSVLMGINSNKNLRGLSGESLIKLCEKNAFHGEGYDLNDFEWAKVGFDEAAHGDGLVAAVTAVKLAGNVRRGSYDYIGGVLNTTALSSHQATAISEVLANTAAYVLIDHLDRFDNLGVQRTKEMFAKMFLEKGVSDTGRINTVDPAEYFRDQFDKFKASGIELDENMFAEMYSAAMKKSSVVTPGLLIGNIESFSAQTQKNVQECQAILAGEVCVPILRVLNDIAKTAVSPELLKLGITTTGEKGHQQLLELLAKYRAEPLKVGIDPSTLNELLENQLLAEMFKTTVRFEESEWGDSDDDSFKSTIQYHLEALADGRLEPMPAEYTPSDIVEVGLLKKKENVVWTEDILDRYTVLRQELQKATEVLANGRGFQELMGNLKNDVTTLIVNLGAKLEDRSLPERAIKNMTRKRDELLTLITPVDESKPNSYPLRSLKTFEQNFRMLAASKELHSSMRKVAFGWALRKNPDWSDRIQQLRTEPDVEDISRAREFVEHIVNLETFKKYFADKKSVSLFKEMVNTKALETGLVRAQGVGLSQNSLPLQFVPTRGIELEFSGHIADACWASTYESIAETMPNMTAVIIKQRPGQKSERLAGAGMLIETKDKKTGEPTLLIRGLNPIENTINQISVEQFYDSFIGYARGIAEKRGMKLALVVDDHAGGAASNRPVLWAYMAGVKKSLKRMTVPNEEVEFNEYTTSDFEVYEA